MISGLVMDFNTCFGIKNLLDILSIVKTKSGKSLLNLFSHFVNLVFTGLFVSIGGGRFRNNFSGGFIYIRQRN